MSTSSSHPSNPALLYDRYELLEEIPFAAAGRLFRARDLAFEGFVGVKFFAADQRLEGEQRTKLENAVRHLQSRPHPHLSIIHSVDVHGGLLIQEWIQGISLLELLRRRRSLPLAEAGQVLGMLPHTLDFLAQEGLRAPTPLLRKLFIQFKDGPPSDAALSGPVGQWPTHSLKLHALSLRGWLNSRSSEDTTHFALPNAQPTGMTPGYSGPMDFARLLFELLGGRIIELDAGRYSPIGALGETGNSILKRALFEQPPASCTALWQSLLEVRPELQRDRLGEIDSADSISLKISESCAGLGAPGVELDLIPVDPDGTPVRLVTRDRFTIGRSLQQADFAARILPENETNDALTNRLSRIHVTLANDGGGMTARDGSGNGSCSLNGSKLEGIPLTADRPTRFADRSLLWLGAEYAMELIPVKLKPMRIGNLEALKTGHLGAADRDGTADAVVCLPQGGQAVARHTAWLFTAAGFGLGASSSLVWDTRGAQTSPAAFHYSESQFWLANYALPEPVLAIADTLLSPGEIAPLVPGQVVRLGSHRYKVILA